MRHSRCPPPDRAAASGTAPTPPRKASALRPGALCGPDQDFKLVVKMWARRGQGGHAAARYRDSEAPPSPKPTPAPRSRCERCGAVSVEAAGPACAARLRGPPWSRTAFGRGAQPAGLVTVRQARGPIAASYGRRCAVALNGSVVLRPRRRRAGLLPAAGRH